MKENYYDILEINKNASPEIVEKAYKTLVKKYHPDLQDDNLKFKYEEKLKVINNAYEVLSDDEKRKQYDSCLEIDNISSEEYDNLYNENIELKTKLNNINSAFYNKKNYSNQNSINSQNQASNIEQERINQLKQQDEYNRQLEYARKKAYHDAYIQDLKNRGYKIRYKKSFKDYLRGFVTIIVIILILFLLFQIPFIQNSLINFYENNDAIHFTVDLINNAFK